MQSSPDLEMTEEQKWHVRSELVDHPTMGIAATRTTPVVRPLASTTVQPPVMSNSTIPANPAAIATCNLSTAIGPFVTRLVGDGYSIPPNLSTTSVGMGLSKKMKNWPKFQPNKDT